MLSFAAQRMRPRATAVVVALSLLPSIADAGAFTRHTVPPPARHCPKAPGTEALPLRAAGAARVLGTNYVLCVDATKNARRMKVPPRRPRLLVFRDDEYLGAYTFEAAAAPKVRVAGGIVRISGHTTDWRGRRRSAPATSFDLRAGPPPNIWFEGTLIDLER